MLKILLLINLGLLVLLYIFNSSKKNRHEHWANLLLVLLFWGIYITIYYHATDIIHIELFFMIAESDIYNEIVQYLFKLRDMLRYEYDIIFPTGSDMIHLLLYIGSLIMVLLYLGLKIFVLTSAFIKNLLYQKSKISLISKPFYMYDNDEIILKDRWIFIGKVSKALGSILFLLSIVYLVENDLALEWSLFLPISSLVFLEIGFFLNGVESNYSGLTVVVEDAKYSSINKFNELYDAYKKKFKDKLLAESKIKGVTPSNNSSYSVKNEYLKQIYNNFDKSNTEICNQYFDGLDKLVSDDFQNVLFSNANDEEYAPYLRIFFDYTYLHNQRILVVVLDDTEKKRTLAWIKRLIEEEVYSAFDCLEFSYSKKNHHILVDTVGKILYDENTIKHYGEFDYFTILDIKNFIRRNHLYLNSLFNVYRAKVNKFPKLLGFSNLSNELETSFNRLFIVDSDDTHEIKLSNSSIDNFYTLVFQSEGRKQFQDYLGINGGQYIGKEIPLGFFAWHEGGIKSIILSSEQSSLDEELEALKNTQKESLLIEEDLLLLNNRYFNQITEKNKLFIVSDKSNLDQTIHKWKNYVLSKDLFLVVVSNSYLFREYMASNFALILKDNDVYKEIFPKGSISKKEHAFLLLARLSTMQVLRNDIKFDDQIVTRKNIATFINRYTEYTIEPSLISVKEERVFEEMDLAQSVDFYKHIYYSIPNKVYLPDLYYYSFVNSNDKMIGICLTDDVYHKYVLNMVIALYGKTYKIIKIDSKNKRIHLEFKVAAEIAQYNIEKKITVATIYSHHKSIIKKEINSIVFEALCLDIDYSCSINSYHTISDHSVRYDIPKIEFGYKKRETLLLRYTTPSVISDTLRKALEFMLTELFKSIFPKNHHLLSLKVVTTESRDDLCYTTEAVESSDNEILLYIFETGQLNYHLLSTIVDDDSYYERVLMLIQDFICWSSTNNKPIKRLTSADTVEDMDFDGLSEFLSIILDDTNKITDCRMGETVSKANDTYKGVVHLCDFCGEELPLQYHKLDDGREQCDSCNATSMEYLGKSYKDLVSKSIKYLEETYAIKINQNLAVEIVNSDTLHKELDISFQPTPGYDPRPIGLAINGETKRIMIENSAPEFRAMATIVHELTHIWQYDNLDFDKMSNDKVKIEGQAQWVELTFISDIFPAQKEFIAQEKSRKDIYGEGYQYVEKVLKNRGGSLIDKIFKGDFKKNPFDAYRDMFGK